MKPTLYITYEDTGDPVTDEDRNAFYMRLLEAGLAVQDHALGTIVVDFNAILKKKLPYGFLHGYNVQLWIHDWE